VRAQPRPHVALSPKGILLSLPHHIQITREKHTQTENTEGRKGKRKGKEISGKRKTAEKHLLKALILFCDKFCANLKNTPGKQENGSKMTRKRP
jgi:hypothetical protein